MSSRYFQRNSGVPLLIKIGVLVVAFYVTFLLLKVFALLLTALFALLKFIIPIAFFAVIAVWLVKKLFGYKPFQRNSYHVKDYRKLN